MKKLVSLSDFESLVRGDEINVSNGQPEPPKHHKKKHRLWACDNYTGFFVSVEFSGDQHVIKVSPTLGGRLVYAYGINKRTFSVIEGVAA